VSPQALGPGPEFDRIRHIIAALGPAASDIGDDCAIIEDRAGSLVVSTDLAIEGVHFRREWLTLDEIGWRAAAAALSDLAAEGAESVGLLASVGLPRGAPESELMAVMTGIGAAVREAGGVVLGGDLSTSEQLAINITVIGRAARPVTRSGAKPGDGIWVTGHLGGARAALEAWQRGGTPAPESRAAFAHPVPRIKAGQALAKAGAHAMLDLSDGLGGDAPHLSAASRVRLEIDLDLLVVAPVVVSAAVLAGLPPAHFAALGGEDYELLVAMSAGFAAAEATDLAREIGVALTRIGSVEKGSGVRFVLGGREVALKGYDHFRRLEG
jgi:thiamine-monophosphate kinase